MVDGLFCTVGSANLDSRSMFFDYEENAVIVDPGTTKELNDLFDKEKDPIELIKWKDILEKLEDTLDHCEKMSDMIRGVVMKYA